MPFIVDLNIGGPSYIVLQTLWMNHIISKSVNDWIWDPKTGLVASRHGFITDIDHSYFWDGNLMVSCAFSGRNGMEEWVPLLYSWLGGLDAPHHWPHFCKLFHEVVDHAGKNFHHDYLTNVCCAIDILYLDWLISCRYWTTQLDSNLDMLKNMQTQWLLSFHLFNHSSKRLGTSNKNDLLTRHKLQLKAVQHIFLVQFCTSNTLRPSFLWHDYKILTHGYIS